MSGASTGGASTGGASMSGAVLRARELSVTFRGHRRPAVRELSLELSPGRCLALVGESGSGKSVTARALLGLSEPGARVRAAELSLNGRDLRGLSEREWARLRGARIGLAVQDALSSLDPVRPIGREIGDALRLHRRELAQGGGEATRAASATGRRELAASLLARLGVDEPQTRLRQRAGQLSGGQRQRALIASAVAARPDFLIADEPTSAVDAIVQRQLIELLGELVAGGVGLLLISHDLGLVSALADEVLVLRHGELVETGPAEQLLSAPRHPYTRELLDASLPVRPRPSRAAPDEPTVLEAQDLRVHFGPPPPRGRQALDGVGLRLRRGETLGVMGASGSGKSTLLRALLGVQRLDGGSVTLDGRPWSALAPRLQRRQRRRLSYVPQDGLGSMDPRWNVEQIVADALPRGLSRHARLRRVDELLETVELSPALAARRAAELSGGQRQRVAIARALAGAPEALLCDEATSALDASVQASVLRTLERIQGESGLAMIVVSHDLGVLARLSDRIAVMTEGRIVEEGPAAQILQEPSHPYTRSLVAASRRSAGGRAWRQPTL